MKAHGTETGQVAIFLIGLLVVCMAVSGLAVDGTRAWLARRSFQNAADAAALAGASEVALDAYYATGGESIVLDPVAAERVARAWLRDRGVPAKVSVGADENGIRVRVLGEMRTMFLRIVGIESVSVEAEARAEPFAGNAP